MTLSASPSPAPDAEALYAVLRDAVRGWVDELPAGSVHLVGLHSGGAWLAERLHADLGLEAVLGTLDISFYRDDYDRIGLHAQVKPSDISFPVDDKHLIVIDDVLYTGRTIRAAMNELFDYGRPASIRLAVLVERSGRELPVEAGIVAAHLDVATGTSVVLSQQDARFVLSYETNPEPRDA